MTWRRHRRASADERDDARRSTDDVLTQVNSLVLQLHTTLTALTQVIDQRLKQKGNKE